jgi:tetratricopeptide (TPR) repeat protein
MRVASKLVGRRPVTRRALPALLALAIASLAVPARAADPRAQGRRHFELAEQRFQKGQYPAALAEYQAGYELTRLPGFLINIAQCYRLTGDLRRARAYYRKYLVVVPASPRKAEIEAVIRALDRDLSNVGGEPPARAADQAPRTPSVRWWVWSALASSVVGSTMAATVADSAQSGNEAAARP